MNWKVFIVTHKDIIEDYYVNDNNFNNDNWGFINVSEQKLTNQSWYEKYHIIDMVSLPKFKSLGKWWTETEAIYNVYLNEIHKDYDFIGFIHHDYELKDEFGNHNITEQINNSLKNCELVYFSTFTKDYFQHIMADINYPNHLVGGGLNCYDYIINDYNKFYNKNENVGSWMSQERNNICSAFLCSRDIFENLMKFSSSIIESGKLNIFDTNHVNRFQGGIFERYYSVFFNKLFKPVSIIELYHAGKPVYNSFNL